jgi:Inner membrane component of T3SS, cytoplasmic domain
MMIGPVLVIRDADGAERTVELREGVMRIGRAAGNEIILGDASTGVSRNHAELHVENGRCTIVDLHSQNGTWVNALRVQRAEVRPDAEIAIGVFRLRVQIGATPGSSAGRMPRPQPATVIAPRPAALADAPPAPPASPPPPEVRPATDLPLMHAQAGATAPMAPLSPPPVQAAAPTAAPRRSKVPLVIGGLAAVAVIALAVFLFTIPSRPPASAPVAQTAPAAQTPAAQTPAAASPAAAPPAVPPTATAPAASNAAPRRSAPASRTEPPDGGAARPGERPARPTPSAPTQTASPETPTSTPPRAPQNAPAPRPGARPADPVRASANELPVPRKPGESLQDWQQRGAALQARYAFAKVALDRGDFAAAAGGFAALLLEEPGFLDAPQLLVKAREGLRVAAAEALEAGNKLDAAGDWVNAIRRYEQAREIDRAVPGLEDAIKRVRDKMHTAGLNALRRARQFDALGRFAEALSEYEKAAQWLSPEDPNQQIAKGRAEQLKARLK